MAEQVSHEQVLAAVARYQAAVDERDAAARVLQAAVDSAAEAVEDELVALGAALDTADTSMDRDVARVIYWQTPDVKVRALAVPLRVRVGEVHQVVGEFDEQVPCRGCGRMLDVTLTSRAGAQGRSASSRMSLCEECRARQDEAWAARTQVRDPQREHNDVAMAEALHRGAPLRPRVVEFEELPGTWVVDADGRPVRAL
jgi:hypothetical protein